MNDTQTCEGCGQQFYGFGKSHKNFVRGVVEMNHCGNCLIEIDEEALFL